MSTREKPRLTVQIEFEDEANIEKLMEKHGQKKSDVVRAALRLALPLLWENPSPFGIKPPVIG